MTWRKVTASLLVLLLLALTVTTTGCWDRREPEDLAFVITLGLDTAPNKQVLLTVQIALPKRLAGGAGPGGGGGGGGGVGPSPVSSGTTFVLSVVAPSIPTALNLINTNVGRMVNLDHNRLIVIGEDMARKNFSRFLAVVVFPEIRRTTFLITTRGRAADFIEANTPFIEANPAKYIEELTTANFFSGLIPLSQLHQFLSAAESYGQEAITILADVTKAGLKPKGQTDFKKQIEEAMKKAPTIALETIPFIAGEIPRAGGNRVEFVGAAVYKGARLVGFLNGSETRAAAALRGEFRRGFILVPNPLRKGFFVIIELSQARPVSVKVRINKGIPEINVRVTMEGNIDAIQGGGNFSVNPAKRQLERAVEKRLTQIANAVVTKAQSQFQADIFGFGDRGARRLFRTWDEWTRYKWLSQFPQARVKVQTSFRVRRIGLQFAPPKPVTGR